MRIDYSEPKKSYISPQAGQSRPRKESSGSMVMVVIITCIISLGVGFGSGWWLSERSAKKGFKKATEQKSAEDSPRQSVPPPLPPKPPTVSPQSADAKQQQTPGGVQTTHAPGNQPTAEPPLSFYTNLPGGHKNNVLGSGINSKDNKPAKQPLQAIIPSNVANPPQSQNTPEEAKPTAPAPVEKNSSQQGAGNFTVQTASLSLRSEAETSKNRLAGKGYNAYIVESNLGNKGVWYRVRVGKGMQQDAAKELAGKLGKGAIVIPEKD